MICLVGSAAGVLAVLVRALAKAYCAASVACRPGIDIEAAILLSDAVHVRAIRRCINHEPTGLPCTCINEDK